MSATSSFTTVVMTTTIPGILLSGVSEDVEQVLNRLLSEASIQNKNKKILLNNINNIKWNHTDPDFKTN